MVRSHDVPIFRVIIYIYHHIHNVSIAWGVCTRPAAVLNRLMGLLPSVINVDSNPRLFNILT